MNAFRLTSKISDTGSRLDKMTTSIRSFIDENSELLQKIMSGKAVSARDFLKLYDTRTYDIHSRENDIKFMKELDFKGVYVIRNISENKYFLGCGDYVFKKVYKHFNGYGHQDIFADYKKKNKFVVYFLKLDSSNFDNLNDFEKDVRLTLKSQITKDQYYHHSSPTKQAVENSHSSTTTKRIDAEKNKEFNRIQSNIIVWIFRILVALFLLNKIST